MSKNDYKTYQIQKGVYLVKNPRNSEIYQLKIRDIYTKTYKFRSTGTDNLVLAKEYALDYLKTLSYENNRPIITRTTDTFEYWVNQLLSYKETPDELSKSNFQNTKTKFDNLVKILGDKNINEVTNEDVNDFFIKSKRQRLVNHTKNKYVSMVQQVLKLAHQQNHLKILPTLKRFKEGKGRIQGRDNPRPAFDFRDNNNELKILYKEIRETIKEKVILDYKQITDELYWVVMFINFGYFRPTVSEVFSIKHEDIEIKEHKGQKVLLTYIKKGKTGFRPVISTTQLVEIYEKLKLANPKYKKNDYIFMSEHSNRTYVMNTFQRQFKLILERCNLRFDSFGQKRSLYSLRHTAIQRRLIESGGKVNMFFLAENCGTSPEIIKRFYAKYLPQTDEVIENLLLMS